MSKRMSARPWPRRRWIIPLLCLVCLAAAGFGAARAQTPLVLTRDTQCDKTKASCRLSIYTPAPDKSFQLEQLSCSFGTGVIEFTVSTFHSGSIQDKMDVPVRPQIPGMIHDVAETTMPLLYRSGQELFVTATLHNAPFTFRLLCTVAGTLSPLPPR